MCKGLTPHDTMWYNSDMVQNVVYMEEIIADEKIGDKHRHAVIWPVLKFSDDVPVDMRNHVTQIWNRYAALRKQVPNLDEASAVIMMGHKNAMLRVLMSESKRRHKTEAARMAGAGAYVSFDYDHPQWMVQA